MTGPMTPETRLGLNVEVLIDGTWWPGTLEHWRKRDGRWEGWVWWSKGPSETRIDWLDEGLIRQV